MINAIFGVLAIVLGMLAMFAPGVAGFSIVFAVGVLVTLAGLVRLAWAFQEKNFGKSFIALAIGGLTLACGIAMLVNPIFASGLFSILLTLYFIADGIIEISASMMLRPIYGWGWLLFSGIVSLLLGVLIFTQFPLSGFWAIGILFGIKLFLIGLVMVTVAPDRR